MNPAAPVTRYLIPSSRLRGDGVRQLLRERDELAGAVLDEAEVGEEARHHDALAEVAEPRLGTLAAGELERELGVAAPRGERQRERAAEARVDVGDRQAAVGLAEALDVGRADDADRLGDPRAVRDQLGVLERPALDRLAALRLDHRARDRVQAAALEVAEHVDRELLAEAALLHHRVDRRRAQVEGELLGVVGAVDVARPEPLAHLDEERVAGVVRERRPGARCAGSGCRASSKNRCARYLSPIVRHTSGLGASTSAGASSSRAAETISWSRSVSGTTRRTSCSATSAASAGT